MGYLESLKAKVRKGNKVFIADNATVIGNVVLGDHSSVWYQAVIRGDNDLISIGSGTNIQDGCIVHVDEGVPVKIGNRVTVGHGAIIHGAEVEDNVLIGMRATLLNHVKIGKNSIVGAHALVTSGTVIPENSLVLGAPAKVVRQLTAEEIAGINDNVESYIKKGSQFLGE